MIKVVKIGGNVVDDPELLKDFIRKFASMQGMKILVHGGGVMASRLQKAMGMEPIMIEGRRVTDEDTLKVVTMVYAGWCSKNIAALLQAEGCNAIGLSGTDGNAIRAGKRKPVAIVMSGKEEAGEETVRMVDYGYVGDVSAEGVNAKFIYSLLEQGIVPVFNAINHDGEGHLLNTNADTIASSVAVAMAMHGKEKDSGCERCELIYCFEKDGVLHDKDDDTSVIPEIGRKLFEDLKREGRIADGMIPKLTNSFKAIDSGVARVVIKHARNLLEDKGTTLI